MTDIIQKTQSAYSYPLLIKSLLFSPVIDNPDQEIVYRGLVTGSFVAGSAGWPTRSLPWA